MDGMLPTFQNPIYPFSFPDPFVLKFRGEYWAYCTGYWKDNRCFGILHSADLIHWHESSGAMEPLPGNHSCYWAPEVAYENGRFFLYYSVGDGMEMHIRAAISDHPAGPFIDSGKRMTQEKFAIDAHVFQDRGGIRYLFYATDYLEHSRPGTGTACDLMLDPLTLAGQPVPVTRALYDWQVFDPNRAVKGCVKWHTLEAPFVLQRKGIYYQMYSGGNWQTPGYSLGYATSRDLNTDAEWEQACDGQKVLPILHSTADGGVSGPGHNSVVRGPDNRQLFCAYHRWEAISTGSKQPTSARVFAIDRLEWAGDRLAVFGPSTSPQPVPISPTLVFFKDPLQEIQDGLGESWRCVGGAWSTQEGAAVQGQGYPGRISEASTHLPYPYFMIEIYLKLLTPNLTSPGAYGVMLDGAQEEIFSLTFLPKTNGQYGATAMVSTGDGERRDERPLAIPDGFDPRAWHLVRIESNGDAVFLSIDGNAALWEGKLSSISTRFACFTRGVSAGFSSFELTAGWEDLFSSACDNLGDLGWTKVKPENSWQIQEGQLIHNDLQEQYSCIVKDMPLEAYELVANVRLGQVSENGGSYGFYPAWCGTSKRKRGPLISLEPRQAGWVIQAGTPGKTMIIPLPPGFDPGIWRQFRFRKSAGRIQIAMEDQILGDINCDDRPSSVGLYADRASVALDMVRVTAIPAAA